MCEACACHVVLLIVCLFCLCFCIHCIILYVPVGMHLLCLLAMNVVADCNGVLHAHLSICLHCLVPSDLKRDKKSKSMRHSRKHGQYADTLVVVQQIDNIAFISALLLWYLAATCLLETLAATLGLRLWKFDRNFSILFLQGGYCCLDLFVQFVLWHF